MMLALVAVERRKWGNSPRAFVNCTALDGVVLPDMLLGGKEIRLLEERIFRFVEWLNIRFERRAYFDACCRSKKTLIQRVFEACQPAFKKLVLP